jgi:hypothetical protein
MAGSYRHLLHGFSMIENLHDAGEALHQMLWLVERSIGRANAEKLLEEEYYPMIRGERQEDPHFLFAERMRRT